MSLLAIGLSFAAASLILFGVSLFLATRIARQGSGDAPESGDNDEVAGLDRPWPI